MTTMNEVFASAQSPLFEEEGAALALILEADDDDILEEFTEADADRLDFLADLFEAAARGPLTAEQELAMEGLGSWIKKKAGAVKKKLAPGTKMVFGRVVKVGKAAVGAAKAVGHAAVTAKRGVQAHTFGFTHAGKLARAAAKHIRDTKGRAAGKATYKAAKGAYQSASRAGETRHYASTQAGKAGAKVANRSKSSEYGDNATRVSAKKAPAKKGSSKKAPSRKVPAKKKATPISKGKKGAPRKGRKKHESMQDVFNLVEMGDTEI